MQQAVLITIASSLTLKNKGSLMVPCRGVQFYEEPFVFRELKIVPLWHHFGTPLVYVSQTGLYGPLKGFVGLSGPLKVLRKTLQ